eukprot:6276839-Pyramimonas_sp.AAC.1
MFGLAFQGLALVASSIWTVMASYAIGSFFLLVGTLGGTQSCLCARLNGLLSLSAVTTLGAASESRDSNV